MAGYVQELDDRRIWTLPPLTKIRAALRGFYKRAPKSTRITVSFKVHKPTKRKIRRLLHAHVAVTNHTVMMLQKLHEEPTEPRSDGAIAHVVAVQEEAEGKFRSLNLSNQLEQEFRPFVPASDFRYAGTFWSGTYRDLAQMLVAWLAHLTAHAYPEGTKLTRELVYQYWEHVEQDYRRAMQVVAALRLSPDDIAKEKDDRLERQSKREARWILERLYPERDIETWLSKVEALRDDEPSELKRSAEYEDAPWYRPPRHQRWVREQHLFRRVAESKHPSTLLGTLEQPELETLAEELQEMLLYYRQVKQIIATVYSADRADSNASNVPLFETILHTFLRGKPASYPHVEPVQLVEEWSPDGHTRIYRVVKQPAMTADTQPPLEVTRLATDPDDGEADYYQALDWFATYPTRRIDVSRMMSAEQEAEAVQRMFAAFRMLKTPTVLPLRFNGTALPLGYRLKTDKAHKEPYLVATTKQARYFALLYHPNDDALVLALFLYGQDGETQTAHEMADYHAHTLDREQRRITTPQTLYYVNFPETSFDADSTSALLLRLEYGDAYQMAIIRAVIHERREAQYRLVQQMNAQNPTLIAPAMSVPDKSPINFGRMICDLDNHGEPTFYFQATVTRPPAIRAPMPTSVLGISMHQEGYSFALLNLSNTTVRTGSMFIPPYLDARKGAKRSDNTIYWIANSIVELAYTHNAFIGIEDARWKKANAGTDRSSNRILFGIPMQRIVDVVMYKAMYAGLMEPRLIHGVSPLGCGLCRTRLTHPPRFTLYQQLFTQCPNCHEDVSVDLTVEHQICSVCHAIWKVRHRDCRSEQHFACSSCSAEAVQARINTAVVVAHMTLIDLVDHWDHLKAFRKRNKRHLQK